MMSKNTRRGLGITAVLLLFAIVAAPPLTHFRSQEFRFNQLWLQRLNLEHQTIDATQIADTVHTIYSSGWNILRGRPRTELPDLEDREGVLNYLFSWLPSYAVIYPTEGFYYFRTHFGEQEIWGNLRIAELSEDKLGLAYFTVPDRQVFIADFGPDDGLSFERASEHEYDLSFRGRTVRFKMAPTARRAPDDLRLLAREEFVGQIYDESGLRFFLIFNHDTNSFYDVLNDERGITDELVPLDGSELLIGERTGFCFYPDEEYDRKILVGVFLRDVYANDYFDGPADQVPYVARLRDKLRLAYPNVMLGEGVDEHGVYVDDEVWMRVAITPYHRYTSLDDLLDYVDTDRGDRPRSEFWASMTREWWNTPEYRRSIVDQLLAEDKNLDDYIPASERDQFYASLAQASNDGDRTAEAPRERRKEAPTT